MKLISDNKEAGVAVNDIRGKEFFVLMGKILPFMHPETGTGRKKSFYVKIKSPHTKLLVSAHMQ